MTAATATSFHPGNVIWKSMTIHTKMFCGAREALLIEEGLRFKVGGKPMRYVEVTLDASDTYTVVYYRIKRTDYSRIILEEHSGIYASMLNETICNAVNK